MKERFAPFLALLEARYAPLLFAVAPRSYAPIEELKNGGIYRIYNEETRGVYIGSAVNFPKRWRAHRNKLQKGKHDNPHLQNAWNKYEESAFSFEIIERVRDKTTLLEREQYWLDTYLIEGNCYNMLPCSTSRLGSTHSEETRRKLSRAGKGREQSKEHVQKRMAGKLKAYHFVAPDGTRHENITDLKAFCKEHGLNINSMRGLFNGYNPSCKGWTVNGGHRPRVFNFVAPDGTEHRGITHLSNFCQMHGLDLSCLAKVHKGKYTQHKGWIALREEQE